jgi:uncharacterized protein (TIGR00725 family)
MFRRTQIGVFGSVSDLKYSNDVADKAAEVGRLLAKQGATVMFGAEKDFDSLPAVAARAAKSVGGLTIGITYGKGLTTYTDDATVVIATGLERGGGREFSLALSCDAIICISGGSGTINEIAVAYQANIPMVALTGTGGWTDQLAGQYLDPRQRVKLERAQSPEEAVKKAILLAKKNIRANQ